MSLLEMNVDDTLLGLMGRHEIYRNGAPLTLVEKLVVFNEMWLDATWIETNNGDSYIGAERTTVPEPSPRRINQGVERTGSTESPFTEVTVDKESRSRVDTRLLMKSRNPGKTRFNKDIAFAIGFGNDLGTQSIYGNHKLNVDNFTGLAPRLNALSAKHVISAGGTGADLTSAYVVCWGPEAATMLYPQGSPPGLIFQDLGQQTVVDKNNLEYEAMISLFTQSAGFAVHNVERDIQRVCNIETAGDTNIFDDDLLLTALNHTRGTMGVPVILVNETLMTQMDILAKDKANVSYTSGEVFGHPTVLFRGYAVRQNDAILDTETAIS